VFELDWVRNTTFLWPFQRCLTNWSKVLMNKVVNKQISLSSPLLIPQKALSFSDVRQKDYGNLILCCASSWRDMVILFLAVSGSLPVRTELPHIYSKIPRGKRNTWMEATISSYTRFSNGEELVCLYSVPYLLY